MKHSDDASTKKLGTVCYLAPVFSPAIGGGVVYLELLSKYLVTEGVCEKFIIVTETFPGRANNEISENGKLQVIRKYPFRAGRNVKELYSYFQYFWQNLQFYSLPKFVRQLPVDILMVHGSFLNNPSSLWNVLKLIRYFSPNIKIVADLRDPKLPMRKVSTLKFFDLIISCSENITQRLEGDIDVYRKVRDIPIIVDVNRSNENDIMDAKLRYRLSGKVYVFSGSGLSVEKGAQRLLELVLEIRKKRRNVALVVAGKRRAWGKNFKQAEQEDWFHYLGQIPHNDVLSLSAGSWLDVNLSTVDSMPRHSLEALCSGARVILPKGVPEFDKECPACIGYEERIEDLASKAIRIAESRQDPCGYRVDRNRPRSVINEYVCALSELV